VELLEGRPRLGTLPERFLGHRQECQAGGVRPIGAVRVEQEGPLQRVAISTRAVSLDLETRRVEELRLVALRRFDSSTANSARSWR
jgi:hypothetical protein